MSTKPALLLTTNSILPDEVDALAERFEVVDLARSDDPEQLLQARKGDIVAIASSTNMPISRQLIEALPKLEIISQFAVGYDNIDVAAAEERGIRVTNTPDVLTDDTADTALALLLAVSRRVSEGDMFVRTGKWLNGPMPLGRALSGKVAGIVGLGRIGQAIATRCQAFGMDIAYQGPREKAEKSYRYFSDVRALAEHSDYLILSCPGGSQTRHMIDGDVLDALGPQGFLVNVSRGSVVVEPELVAALAEARIAGAGLDVYANEPRVPEALFRMDNVVLLPHVGSATVETRKILGELVVKNLLAHFDGDPLLTPIA